MKIALLQFYSKNPTPVYDELARVLRTAGQTVWVGTPDENGDLAWHDGSRVFHRTRGPGRTRAGARFLRALSRRLAQILFILRVRSDVVRFAPDIVQVNKTTYAGLLPWFLPPGCRMIYDVRQLGLWGEESIKGRFANWRVVRRVRRNSTRGFALACYPSELAAVRILGAEWRRHAVITPIAVHPEFLEFPLPPAGRAKGDERVRFIYVGSLVAGRRLNVLLDAADLLRQSSRAFELALIGPGDGASAYKDQVSRLGLQEYVRILPPVPYRSVPEIVSGYDVAIAYVPAIEDWRYQVTLKVLEFRALGLPIIASDLPPNREVVEDGINGVIAGNTPEAFCGAMKRFFEPGFLASCRSRALTMRQGKTWADVARVHETDVYSRVHPKSS
jgi:glycosyltransferase involved in cell wall biosynthesis